MIKDKSFARLVSPASDKNRPRYNWHAFKHGYSKELVEKLLEYFEIEKGWILDPFCGGGTTLLTCKEKGINSTGIDILPFSIFLSKVKTTAFKPDELKRILSTFEEIKTEDMLPDVGIIDKAFSPGSKQAILRIRAWIGRIADENVRNFFLLALLGVIDEITLAVKSGGFLRIIEKKPPTYKETIKAFQKISEKMIQDVKELPLSKKGIVETRLGDARSITIKRKYDAVITSPPYPNRHDYTRIYALELLTGFISSNKDLKDLRYRTLRSHVEARKQFEAKGYKQPKKLKKIISELKTKKMNNNNVIPTLEGYFEDMFLVLKEMKGKLKKNGKIGLVVSNVRYAGVNLPVDILLGEIGEQAGLHWEKTIVARNRGNSAQQMKNYSRKPSRESIITWKK